MGDSGAAMKTISQAIDKNPNVEKYYIIRTKLYILEVNFSCAPTINCWIVTCGHAIGRLRHDKDRHAARVATASARTRRHNQIL